MKLERKELVQILRGEEQRFREALDAAGIPEELSNLIDFEYSLEAYLGEDLETSISSREGNPSVGTRNDPKSLLGLLVLYTLTDKKEKALDLATNAYERGEQHDPLELTYADVPDSYIDGEVEQNKENLGLLKTFSDYIQQEGNYERLRGAILATHEAQDQEERTDDLFAFKPKEIGNTEFVLEIYNEIRKQEDEKRMEIVRQFEVAKTKRSIGLLSASSIRKDYMSWMAYDNQPKKKIAEIISDDVSEKDMTRILDDIELGQEETHLREMHHYSMTSDIELRNVELLWGKLEAETKAFQEALEANGAPSEYMAFLDFEEILFAHYWRNVGLSEDCLPEDPEFNNSSIVPFIVEHKDEEAFRIIGGVVGAIRKDGWKKEKPSVKKGDYNIKVRVHRHNREAFVELARYLQQPRNFETVRDAILETCDAYNQIEKTDNNLFADKPDGMSNIRYTLDAIQAIERAQETYEELTVCENFLE